MADPLDYTAAEVMAAMSAAMKEDDMPAVASLLRLLAVISPTDAGMIAATLGMLDD